MPGRYKEASETSPGLGRSVSWAGGLVGGLVGGGAAGRAGGGGGEPYF